jgi:putative phage-type endonuclease
MTDIIQGSEDWFAARIGKVTASRVADVLATIKTGESASRKNYRMELVCPRLTGQREEGFTNSHMERGIELEPLARASYEFKTGVTVTEIGFADHPSIEMSGASPDGLVGLYGLVEIKCPTAANHVETLLSGKAPTKYIAQMQWQMACTGARWCDFVSYCPAVGDNLALFVVRIDRDDEYIAETEKAVQLFLTEVSDLTKQLKELK